MRLVVFLMVVAWFLLFGFIIGTCIGERITPLPGAWATPARKGADDGR